MYSLRLLNKYVTLKYTFAVRYSPQERRRTPPQIAADIRYLRYAERVHRRPLGNSFPIGHCLIWFLSSLSLIIMDFRLAVMSNY